MSPELSLLSEVWTMVRPHVGRKEQLEVAEGLVRAFDEALGGIDDADSYLDEFDSVLRAAFVSHYGIDDLDEDDEWE
jgi:CRISPR/Cas system CSM-associated protein Csm2 small subunit